MTDMYEVVGAIERGVADTLGADGDTIFVDDGDSELLIAKPAERDEDD